MVAKRAALVAAGLMAVACGTPAATPASGGRPWDAMGPAERLEYMQSTVMPRMQAVFEAFDEHRFGDVTCATCHRGRAAADGWAMPAPDLLLEPTTWNTGAAEPNAAPSTFDAFMAERVTPEMARLLGRSAGPGQRGFACFGCHTPER
ncbi:MAG TPA: hypothetical protein PKA88_23310 [Polyangiaceae bacterium]|nr:hypothetical protein [Polyangiaceae bacterium]